jgi:hypothetical protein
LSPAMKKSEIALVRLPAQRRRKYLCWAEFFLDERGRESHAKLGNTLRTTSRSSNRARPSAIVSWPHTSMGP